MIWYLRRLAGLTNRILNLWLDHFSLRGPSYFLRLSSWYERPVEIMRGRLPLGLLY